jgi:hypothetical protein
MAKVEAGQFRIGLVGTQAQEMLFKPIFFDAEIEEIFDVMVMVNKKQNVGYVGAMEDIMQLANGCGWTPKGSLSLFERCIDTEEIKVNLEMCYDEFVGTVYKQKLKAGSQSTNLEGTVFAQILMTRMQQSLRKQMLKAAFFGNKASTDEAVNMTDGMWSVYLPQLVAANLIPYINSNSGTPLGAGDGIDLLTAVWENASNVLSAVPEAQKVLLVSANVYRQYLQDLQNNGVSSAAHLTLLTNGAQRLTFNGIEVRPMYDWAQYAAQYLAIPADANFVLYTERTNLVLGTDIANPTNQAIVWHDEEEEKLKVKSRFYLGFNYKHSDFFTVAY